MFRHTLLLAYRSFRRFKSTFFINLIGLSTGLAGALLIYLWVHDELAIDKFHENHRRLFHVKQNVPDGEGGLLTIDNTPGPLGKAMEEEIPQVEEVVLVSDGGGTGILSIEENRLKVRNLYVTPNFFKIFSYELVQGDKDRVLRDKLSIVLSDELATRLFPATQNIIGKTIAWEQGDWSGAYTIAGIFKKPPRRSSAQFDIVFPYQAYYDKKTVDLQNWGSSDPRTYVLLQAGTDGRKFSSTIANFLKAKYSAAKGVENLKWVGTLLAQRYSDEYLYNQFENGVQTGGRIAYVKLFAVIAVFILAIACINFMNLSTAKASRRLKEIGIKKVMGADRKTLMLQYLGESLLLTLLALAVASLLVVLLLPAFNQITGKQLSLHFDFNLILSVLGIALFTGLIAGSYPALYLSGFNPITVLKGKLLPSAGEAWARQGLVVFQFAVSVILIVAVVVVYGQIQLIQTKNLGYKRDNIIQFSSAGKLRERLGSFLQEVKNMPGVVSAASMGGNLTGSHGGTFGLEWEGKNPNENVDFGILNVDADLIQTLGIPMAAGRFFSREFGRDSSNIIFNEAAIAAMGLKDPVGKTVKVKGEERQIVGVVKDFHFESLYNKVKPLFFEYSPNQEKVLVKIAAGKERETIEQISKMYKEFNQSLPFEYTFLDEDFQKLYAAENRVAVLSQYFAGIAILISCLGLFGLAAFTAERRRKEIGVRKVLGASRFSIVYLLSSDFTKLVVVAICLSLPVSYLMVKHWLQNFEYRIALEWWYFVGAGLAALLIAWLTVSTQAVKAASVNPAHSLKDE